MKYNSMRIVCTVSTVIILGSVLILPIAVILMEALVKGTKFFFSILFSEYALNAILLSMGITLFSVLSATIFGIAAAWCISHFSFPGKSLLSSIIDLPIAMSPIIIGLMFVIIYGKYGFIGSHLEDRGMVIIFSWPGLLLTNMCITAPYVLRSVLPSMQALSSLQEEAARLLGAKGWQILFRITLPRIKWSLIYGVILAVARSSGEFGAASVVSGFIRKKTVTLPLLVEIYYSEYLSTSAFACAVLFVFLSVFTLITKYIAHRNSPDFRAKRSPQNITL